MNKFRVQSKRIISLLICLAMLGSLASADFVVKAGKSTSGIIQEKEKQINEVRKEKKAIENSLSNLKGIKSKLETEKANLKSYVAELDNNLQQMEENIHALSQKIEIKETEIEAAYAELEAAEKREQEQKESMIARIRCVYESNSQRVYDVLLKSDSIGDMLNKADYVEKVVSYDQRMLENYKEAREYADLCRQELELDKEILEVARQNLEAEQKNLEELVEQKRKDITEYEANINTQEKAIQEYLAEIKARDEEIKSLEAVIAAERRKQIENQGNVVIYDGGKFKFPLASYTRISDDYGNRMHPILKINQFHSGVDFAAPKGTAIYAAYDGVVVAATYNVSMGNYVMIDHGNNLYTIYMHASSLSVKKDDVVVKGETIAAVGSTGRSTGNHLHFSVRLNGEYVSPWNYLSK